ncbi:amino acid ABC transporter permease [Pseudonocardia sichuanensis]
MSDAPAQTAARATTPGAAVLQDVPMKPRPQVLLWVVAAVLVLVAADVVHGAAVNPRLPWGSVAAYFFDPDILAGLGVTVVLAVASLALATVLGLVLALMALSRNPVLTTLARVYTTVFRSIPTIVQMLFWYYLAAILPVLSIGIPFGPTLVAFDTNILITQFAAAMLGLGLGQAAFLAEYFRGGILSVPRGQVEAAASCGLTPVQTFRRVVAPQAMRVVLPSYGNAAIINLKNTSVVFVVGAGDLMTRAQLIYSQNFQQIPLLIVVIAWYLILVTLMTVVQRRIELHFSRGYGESREPRRSLRTRWSATFGTEAQR